MKKLLTCLVFSFLITPFLFAQDAEWYEMMQNPYAKFAETQAAALDYFDRVGTGKGTGWKQFKRWEYYMESRVAEDGLQTYPSTIRAAYQKYQRQHPEMINARRNSTNGAWNELGPVTMPNNGTGQPNGLGRTAAIGFHPTDVNTFYVGSASGGIWKTTDYGATWTDQSVNLNRLSVSSIVVHPTTPNIVYAATGDRDGGDAPGYGVWRSTDSGATWNPWNTGMGNRTCYEILMHPSNPLIMICSTNGRIWRTVDGGANWTSQYSGGENFKDLAFHPTNPNIVYAASNDYYRSTDNGVTWGQVTSGVPTGVQRFALAVTAASPNTVYLLAGDGGGLEGLYRSTDSGQNFTQRSNSPNIFGYGTTGGSGSQAWYDIVMIGDDANANHIIMGAINVWESFDGGATWSIVTHWTGSGGNPAVHADQHVLEYNPVNGNLFLGSDGGVHFTADGGANWTEISSGLPIAQVYKIGQAQTSKDLVINGYQDNGTAIWYGTNWSTEIGGDGMECIIDYSDENYMYGALYYGDIRRSSNRGATFGGITGGISESGAWVTPYKLHPTDPNTMFVGMRNVWRTTNVKAGTPTWTVISALGGTSTIRDIAIAPSDPNVVYIARSGSNNFYRSNNAMSGSPTWTSLDGSLPGSGWPSDIEIDPTDPTHLWIGWGNDIYESTNSGASWTNIAGTLPALSLNTIVYDTRSTNDALYVGMDVGVYYRDNSLPDWVPFSAGLPNVEVTELEIYYDATCAGNDMLRAGTYGRGLWETDLRDPGNVAPIACFQANPANVCVGQTVMLEDLSAYTPTSWTWSITPATYTYVNSTTANSQNPQVQFNAVGAYDVQLTATNANGSDIVLTVGVVNVTGTSILPPITEDFETAALCGTASDCGTTVCALPNGWINWTNGSQDDVDWRIDEGGTPSSNTGPNIDANPGTATGNYAYLEASSCFGRTGIMVSPCLDFRTLLAPEVIFSYHMFGGNMGELHFDVFANGVWNLDVSPVITGDQGNAWLDRTVDLTSYAGQVVQIRFRGITGGGFQSDMALDNLRIREGSILNGTDLNFAGEFIPGTGNELRWDGYESIDGQFYILERQLQDGNYAEIHRTGVTGQDGSFDYMDTEPYQGRNVYRLRIQDVNGNFQEAGIVEINSRWEEESITLYPNPHNGNVNLQVQANTAGPVQVQIIDVMGKEVFRTTLDIEQGIQQKQFDLQHLEPGVYFFKYKDQTVRMVRM